MSITCCGSQSVSSRPVSAGRECLTPHSRVRLALAAGSDVYRDGRDPFLGKNCHLRGASSLHWSGGQLVRTVDRRRTAWAWFREPKYRASVLDFLHDAIRTVLVPQNVLDPG